MLISFYVLMKPVVVITFWVFPIRMIFFSTTIDAVCRLIRLNLNVLWWPHCFYGMAIVYSGLKSESVLSERKVLSISLMVLYAFQTMTSFFMSILVLMK
jgi:hypothetical protein